MFMIDSRQRAAQMIRSPTRPIVGSWMRTSAALIFALLIAACTPQQKPQPTTIPPVSEYPANFPTTFYTTAQAGTVYRGDPARSACILKVYKSGTLAAL